MAMKRAEKPVHIYVSDQSSALKTAGKQLLVFCHLRLDWDAKSISDVGDQCATTVPLQPLNLGMKSLSTYTSIISHIMMVVNKMQENRSY